MCAVKRLKIILYLLFSIFFNIQVKSGMLKLLSWPLFAHELHFKVHV